MGAGGRSGALPLPINGRSKTPETKNMNFLLFVFFSDFSKKGDLAVKMPFLRPNVFFPALHTSFFCTGDRPQKVCILGQFEFFVSHLLRVHVAPPPLSLTLVRMVESSHIHMRSIFFFSFRRLGPLTSKFVP